MSGSEQPSREELLGLIESQSRTIEQLLVAYQPAGDIPSELERFAALWR